MVQEDAWHAVTIPGGLGAAVLLVRDSLDRVIFLQVFRIPFLTR